MGRYVDILVDDVRYNNRGTDEVVMVWMDEIAIVMYKWGGLRIDG